MEDVLDEVVSSEDLKKFERVYNEQLHKGEVTQKAQFEYAWCLVRSRYSADIRKGIILLEELFQTDSAEGKRDYLYYLAIGNARIKEYNRALQYVRAFLQIEPSNQQVQNLETLIKKKMEKEGLLGMALAGGAVLAIGGLVGLGLALSKGRGK
ncbi:mitochondrial fission 1 protein-like isoform X1 [Anabrus simplex]|uniref:mitochondrial fission 1 protein-like isoform X1 n=1 Tax=Anabrus simplex TaxID=316456 RepID=UPI0034DD7C57